MASTNPNSRQDPRYGRPNPLGTGLIIAASVLVAAGIAIYESPQVRQFIEHSRRKIAVALHSLGDEIQPRRNSQSSANETPEQTRRKRMEEIVRRNQNELIRQAQAEGIAVDLDELARIGREGVEVEMMEYDRRTKNQGQGGSFDDIVGSDGMLRDNHPLIKLEDQETIARTATATENATATEGLRRRGQGGPIIFDQEHLTEEPSSAPLESRESTATLEGEPLIDMNAEDPPLSLPEEHTQTASIHSLPSSYDNEAQAEVQDGSQSFHSFESTSVMSISDDMQHSNHNIFADTAAEEAEAMSTGTLTPTEDGMSAAVSMVGNADDIAVMSLTNDDDHDARSEAFSEGGFSELSEGDRAGAHTPNSWTDVGSDDGESEYGGPQVASTQYYTTNSHL